ncbi:hypothetical protein FHS59_003592 [Algoriphagus iocasae]|uniref:Fucosyltransferase C-terminal domain-containing protein n=1 Tax=Algoriphagus iocasae TaxID=1836499 RepID=A0A841MQR7_9BACT|nr:glycosyltransferase family 10 [Algoriphagus iocasae]MBB6327949.1 hypothetical protein [Algoriphagus iocasae]
MKFINILTRYNFPNFIHQLDNARFKNIISFHENSSEEIIWDFIVVYEGINEIRDFKVKKGGLIFISGEPPMSSVYPKKFLDQFDLVISSHPRLNHPRNILFQQGLNWHFGYNFRKNSYSYTYESLINLALPVKTKNISIISSSKRMMPGHRKRSKLIGSLMKQFPDSIDFFGKGIKPIDDKADALLPYRFHICIENSFINDYWTEKFADPLLGYSVPIYIGCPNIKKYFDDDFYFHFNISDSNGLVNLIHQINQNPVKIYNEKIGSLIEGRKKLLNEYNIFSLINFIIPRITLFDSFKYYSVSLLPCNHFKIYNFLLYKLRLRRLILRFISLY